MTILNAEQLLDEIQDLLDLDTDRRDDGIVTFRQLYKGDDLLVVKIGGNIFSVEVTERWGA